MVQFVFEYLLTQEDASDPRGKARIVDQILPLLRDVANSVERDAYAQDFATRLGLDPMLLVERLRVRERVAAYQKQSVSSAPPKTQADLEKHILAILLRAPDLEQALNAFLMMYELEPFRPQDLTGQARLVWESWQQAAQQPALPLETWLPPDVGEWLSTVLQSSLPDNRSELEHALRNSLLRLRKRRVEALIENLTQAARQAQAEGRQEDLHQIMALLQAQSSLKKRLDAALVERKAKASGG